MAIQLVSVASDGSQADGVSFDANVSADGRIVGFVSDGNNLAPGDDDRELDATDAFVRDLATGTTEAVGVGDMGQFPVYGNVFATPRPFLSADGRFVAFTSVAGNLVPGDTTNTVNDLFVRDRDQGTTKQITSDGDVQITDISDNGRKILFSTTSSAYAPGDDNDSVDVFVADLDAGTFEWVSATPDGPVRHGRLRQRLFRRWQRRRHQRQPSGPDGVRHPAPLLPA